MGIIDNITGGSQKPPVKEPPPIKDARKATDQNIQAERNEADAELQRRLALPHRQTRTAVDHTRRESDQELEVAQQEAHQAAATPAIPPAEVQETIDQQHEKLEAALTDEKGDASLSKEGHAVAHKLVGQAQSMVGKVAAAERAKAEAVVHDVVDRAKETLEEERARLDAVTAQELLARKRAFLDILARERRDTDSSLSLERQVSDVLVWTRDEVLSLVSHDLRNLAAAIDAKSAMLVRRLKDHAELQKMAEGVRSSVSVLARWAGDLVDLSSINTGTLELNPGHHKPSELIEMAVQTFSAVAQQRGIRLTVSQREGEIPLFCDRERIVQVLGNLIDNALKVTPPRGTVLVHFERRDDEEARFSVSDTGPGLPEELRFKIFERRWHGERHQGGGSGLGLYISKQIAERHGGRIWAQNRPGGGAVFTFTVPV